MSISSCPVLTQSSPPPATKRFHYRRVVHIPLVKTYPKYSHDNYLPWFYPKTLVILPTNVHVHVNMHGALVLAYEKPKALHRLQQASTHLTILNNLVITLYLAHNTKISKPSIAELIPCTLAARFLINQVCASWQRDIEQLMTTVKLVIVHIPHLPILPPSLPSLTKRKTKRAYPQQYDDDRKTFNTIKSTLTKHGTLSITLQ